MLGSCQSLLCHGVSLDGQRVNGRVARGDEEEGGGAGDAGGPVVRAADGRPAKQQQEVS